ncbi:uncharacterized protein LOC128353034 [Hemicordylus capensis]|uniref:uncharacterized protein LOC128353034 n=1 Tax=Hemicordylus capensis TaxID=884348 RepID=UPI0023038A06|nr:uncharacterized protein LOC128353034 [Hemicordylus capensis]
MMEIFKQWVADSRFPFLSTASLVGVAACLLALCTVCRRRDKNRTAPQDGTVLIEASLLRQTEHSSPRESAHNRHKPHRVNSKGKTQRPTSINIPYSLNEDDGAVLSSSFLILPQRDLPQIPPAGPLSPDQTYSNLSFLNPNQEVLYESVTVIEDERESSSPRVEDAVPKAREDHTTGGEYARVLKVRKKENQPEVEPGTSQATALQEPSILGVALTPRQTVQVEEMYSVVCKARKKKAKDSEELSEERRPTVEAGQGNGQGAAVRPESSDGRAGCQSSLSEPCYESVNCESWVGMVRNGKQAPEPAYEPMDIHWNKPKRRGKSKLNTPTENLYESIENIAFQFQNRHGASTFEM